MTRFADDQDLANDAQTPASAYRSAGHPDLLKSPNAARHGNRVAMSRFGLGRPFVHGGPVISTVAIRSRPGRGYRPWTRLRCDHGRDSHCLSERRAPAPGSFRRRARRVPQGRRAGRGSRGRAVARDRWSSAARGRAKRGESCGLYLYNSDFLACAPDPYDGVVGCRQHTQVFKANPGVNNACGGDSGAPFYRYSGTVFGSDVKVLGIVVAGDANPDCSGGTITVIEKWSKIQSAYGVTLMVH
jgi:hypothetical protein